MSTGHISHRVSPQVGNLNGAKPRIDAGGAAACPHLKSGIVWVQFGRPCSLTAQFQSTGQSINKI